MTQTGLRSVFSLRAALSIRSFVSFGKLCSAIALWKGIVSAVSWYRMYLRVHVKDRLSSSNHQSFCFVLMYIAWASFMCLRALALIYIRVLSSDYAGIVLFECLFRVSLCSRCRVHHLVYARDRRSDDVYIRNTELDRIYTPLVASLPSARQPSFFYSLIITLSIPITNSHYGHLCSLLASSLVSGR